MEATEGAQPGVETTQETPTEPVESPAPENTGETNATEAEKLEAQVSPKSQNRFQKLASENKTFRERIAHMEALHKELEGARALDAALRSDPRKLQYVKDLLEGKIPQGQSEQEDPYKDFAPEVAERFRKVDAIEKRLADEDRQRQEFHKRSLEENRAHLETVFEEKLKTDGFIQKDGAYDESEVGLLSDAVLSRATRLAKDPSRITEKELNTAYDQIMAGTQALEKRGLKRTVKTTPPPSASNRGSVPTGKAKQTDEERVLQIARELA